MRRAFLGGGQGGVDILATAPAGICQTLRHQRLNALIIIVKMIRLHQWRRIPGDAKPGQVINNLIDIFRL